MNEKIKYIITIIIGVMLSTDSLYSQNELYDNTRLLKYIIDSVPQQTQSIAEGRYKDSPPLRPDRFRRRMKIMWGIDINDYPKNALVWFGPEYRLSLSNQIIMGFYRFGQDEAIYVPPPSERAYIAFGKYFLYYDEDVYNFLLDYIKEVAGNEKDFYYFVDMLLTIYNSGMSVPSHLMTYIDSMAETQAHKLHIFYEYQDNTESGKYSAFRVSEIKSDLVYLYIIKEQQTKGRILCNVSHPIENMINIGFYIDGKHLSYGKNELGYTFCRFTLFVCEKEEIYKNRLRLGVDVSFLEYIFVFG